MPYAIIDIEITQALPTIVVPDNHTGIAVIIRCRDKPVGFLMKELQAESRIMPENLAEIIERHIDTELFQEKGQEPSVPPSMTTALPSLTVAVCTKDRPELLARCLGSLQKLQRLNARESQPFEILVVDNAPSDDRSKELVTSLPGTRYVKEPKPGLNFARNRAIQESTGTIIAFIDDDVVVDRGWLDGLTNAWVENPDAAAFTGQVLPYELSTDAQILVEKLGGFRKGFKTIRYDKTISSDPVYPCTTVFGNGCNMAFQRQMLSTVGEFDEALDTGAPLPGGGDLDILYRIVRAGYPLVYEPQMLAFHQHRPEHKQLRNQICRSWGLGLMAFLIKTHRYDPSQRWKVRRFIKWWLKDLVRQLAKSVMGRHVIPPDLVFLELWGATLGLLGGYSRSVRRIKTIRAQFS